jgi:histidine ammonia-lyase
MPDSVILGPSIGIDEVVAVARYGAIVEFSDEYKIRVETSRALVEQWVEEGRVIYGVTTGFGQLSNIVISPEDAEQLQKNIILSHSTSVGKALTVEQARAVMVMVLQNLGQGYSGVRLLVLEKYREFLNKNLTPWAPREGSVGYLCPEAHMALTLTGKGQAYYEEKLLSTTEALEQAGIEPIALSSKEGLALVSGTTSVTGLAVLALYDMLKAAKSADIIASMTLEVLRGIMAAFDSRVMSVRPHVDQGKTASNVRRILADSQVIANSQGLRIQDALSLRCIPQLHGAAKKTLEDAKKTVEIEINSCCDNPIIWSDPENQGAISACNADSSYVGIEMDCASIAATALAKMSERRNNRMIDENLSGLPWFLIQNPGLNSGLMIPQYTQAGLLGDMRILSTPSTIDNTPTCGNQEDYVAMGYNSSKKAIDVAEKLEYILAIELLSVFEAQIFLGDKEARSSVTTNVVGELSNTIPVLNSDKYLYPYIEYIRDFIHSGKLISLAEEKIGQLD